MTKPTSSKSTVLLVQNDPAIRTLYRNVLENNGYDVLEASEGTEGWELIRKKKPDCVILDQMMPGLTGFDILEQMQKDPGTQKIPAIIFSLLDEEKYEKKALDMGAAEYVAKGKCSPKQMLQKIETLLTAPAPAATASTQKEIYRLTFYATKEDGKAFKKRILPSAKTFKCQRCKGPLLLEISREDAYPEKVFAARVICRKCGEPA